MTLIRQTTHSPLPGEGEGTTLSHTLRSLRLVDALVGRVGDQIELRLEAGMLFQPASDALHPAVTPWLRALAARIRGSPNLSLLIVAQAEAAFRNSEFRRLAIGRALSTYGHLASHGVPATRMRVWTPGVWTPDAWMPDAWTPGVWTPGVSTPSVWTPSEAIASVAIASVAPANVATANEATASEAMLRVAMPMDSDAPRPDGGTSAAPRTLARVPAAAPHGTG